MGILGKIGGDISQGVKNAGGSLAGFSQDLQRGDLLSALQRTPTGRFLQTASPAALIADQLQAAGLTGGQEPLPEISPELLQQIQQFGQAGGGASGPAFTTMGLGPLPGFQAAQVGQVGNISLGGPSQFVGDQAALIQSLQQQAAGQGPNIAGQMLKAEQDKLLNQQLAMAASQSGRALPAAQRQIAQQGALGQQQALQQAAIMRAQEQMAAQQQLSQALGTFRGQDIQRAGLGLEAARANQDTALRRALANQQAKQQANMAQSEQAFQAQRFAAEQDFARQQAEEQRRQMMEQLKAQREQAALSAKTGLEQAKLGYEVERQNAQQQLKNQIIGSALSTGAQAGVAALSDKRAKNSIKDFSEKDLNAFFKAIKPKTYKYNNEHWGNGGSPGEKIGFLIQDIENTKVGKSLVKPHESGLKGYNPQDLQGIILAKLAFDAKKKKS